MGHDGSVSGWAFDPNKTETCIFQVLNQPLLDLSSKCFQSVVTFKIQLSENCFLEVKFH